LGGVLYFDQSIRRVVLVSSKLRHPAVDLFHLIDPMMRIRVGAFDLAAWIGGDNFVLVVGREWGQREIFYI
jgi:hypothetical protein